MKRLFLLSIFSLISLLVTATHMRSGSISVQRIGIGSSLTCRVTITVFTDTSSPVLFGGEDVLDFGDGTFVPVPETAAMPFPGFVNVGIATYTVNHTFPGPGHYIISYMEPNRNDGVINMDNSVSTTFYIETRIDLATPDFHSTPDFLIGPVFHAKLGSPLSLSVGAVSEDDYILHYEFGIPFRDRGTPVQNYQLPENIQINPFNGLITWDTKFNDQYIAGEYTFNIKIHLYKKVDDLYYRICTVSRDIQIILEDTAGEIIVSSNTELDENGRIYIPANETRTIKVFYEKQNIPSTVELTAYSELEDNASVFSFITYDSVTAEHIKVGVLTLTSDPSIDRENPYLITVRGRHDNFASDVSFLFYTQDLQPEIIDVVTGSEDEQPSIGIYPNPSKDFLIISLPENQKALVSINDQAGNLVVANYEIAGVSSVDIRQLSRGFYYCTIMCGSKTKRLKFIKN